MQGRGFTLRGRERRGRREGGSAIWWQVLPAARPPRGEATGAGHCWSSLALVTAGNLCFPNHSAEQALNGQIPPAALAFQESAAAGAEFVQYGLSW